VQGDLRWDVAMPLARAVRGELDAGRLQAWLNLPVLLDGRVALDVDASVECRRRLPGTEGALYWAEAGAGLPRTMPLGQYRAELEAREGALGARIESGPESVLEATGTASWHPAGTIAWTSNSAPGPGVSAR
jgi:general secretion pathway protein N